MVPAKLAAIYLKNFLNILGVKRDRCFFDGHVLPPLPKVPKL